MEFKFTKHALERLFSRRISPKDCREVFLAGEIVEEYPNDQPFPSCLTMSKVSNRILHVVTAREGDTVHVITAYEPDPKKWLDDFRRRVN